MTKLRKIILIPALLFVSVSGFFSCGVDRWPEYAHQTALDSWMLELMQQNYLWYQELPSYDDVNLFVAPDQFLSKIKSRQDNYSYVDTLLDSPLLSYGFDYSLVRNPDIDTAYNALVTYVIPGSPAAAVLKRGDWIVKVDTSYISRKYEEQLLQGTAPIKVTLGRYQQVPPTEPPVEGQEQEDVYKVVPVGDPVEIGAAVPLTDNPMHCKKIIPLNDGSEVGYLMYNSFTAGTPENPEQYNNELRAWSDELAQKHINKVILDLRYNKGGSLECVQLLSTLLVSSYYLNEEMAFVEYNDKCTDKNTTLTFNSELLNPGGKNLDLHTLIVLISGETAGAPEMLMNSLNKKIQNLIAIGSSTKGQNVATEGFINQEFRWSVHPVVATVYNSEKETYGGFQPTYAVSASNDYLNFKPFGDKDEALLSVALGVLNKTYPPEGGDQVKKQQTRMSIVKTVCSPSSRVFAGSKGLDIQK